MGFFDKLLDAVRLNDDYDEDDEDFYDEEEQEEEREEKPRRSFFSGRRKTRKAAVDDFDDEPYDDPAPKPPVQKYPTRQVPKPAASQKVTPIRHSNKSAQVTSGGMEVCVIKPTSMEDYREIADTLIANCTVLLNLEGLDVELAQRIIDMSAGSCYALGGVIRKVSSYIVLLAPHTVEISGDTMNLLSSAIPAHTMRNDF